MPRPMPRPKSIYACFLPRISFGARTIALRSLYASRTNTEKPPNCHCPLAGAARKRCCTAKCEHSDLVAFLDRQKELAPPAASPFETAASRPPQGEGTGVACSRHVIARSASDEAIHSSLCDAVDCFAALAMTAEHAFAISRRIAPEASIVGPHKEEGAGKTGCALHPRSRVQCASDKTHTSIQVQREHPGLPCAVALRLISCSPR